MTIKSLVYVLPLAFFGWMLTLITIGLLSDDAPAQVVLFPSSQFMSNLPSQTSIVSFDNWSVTLSSQQSGFAKTLYKSGAFIVLPSGLNGCLPL